MKTSVDTFSIMMVMAIALGVVLVLPGIALAAVYDSTVGEVLFTVGGCLMYLGLVCGVIALVIHLCWDD